MYEIFLAPVENTTNSTIGRIKSGLEKYFSSNVKILKLKLELQKAYSPERNQYYSTELIAQTAQAAENGKGKIIVLLQSDLYVPVLTFVYGEAQLNGRISVVSLCRLHEEFYTGNSDDELLLKRALKELLHELGHNFGLYHCRNWDCVMHSSTSIEEIDIKGDSYCDACLATIGIAKV